jgi:hypothetical protein
VSPSALDIAKYFTISVSLTLAVTACAPEKVGSEDGGGSETDGGEAELTLGTASRTLAITSEALYFVREASLVRFDRSTEEEQILATNVLSDVLEVNHARLFYSVQGDDTWSRDVVSVPLDGGDSRLEARVEGCVGRCIVVTDDTLFHSGGQDGDPGAMVVAVDLASGSSNVLVTPWAASITVDDTTIYGASCYDAWSVPRGGGEAFIYDWGEVLGCPNEIAMDGESLLFNTGGFFYDAGILYGAPVDTLVPEVLVDQANAFVVHEGVIFASIPSEPNGSIVRVDDGGQQELVSEVTVLGIAVEGDDLYWLHEDGTVQHLAL